MRFLPLIEAKREGRPLPPEQWREAVAAFTAGRIPDYQMAAFLMAVFFRGMDAAETRALTLAMRDSGEVLHFPADPRPLADKHSTGGVGDKVSLPLAPLLACLGLRVPMISGRGLGITGGTLDKLETIPGLTTRLAPAQIVEQVQRLGVAMAGQTAEMVPADRLLYALRDATGTVPSIPLITASILSKKLAENLDALVLDVKFGSAAFMSTHGQARQLASAMTALGAECGVTTRALLTRMDTPLGRAAGNWLEVRESVACLRGEGPPDLLWLVQQSAAHLLLQTGRTDDPMEALEVVVQCLASGQPLARWEEMIAAQGARLTDYHALLALDAHAPVVRELRADRTGVVTRCDARLIGEAVRDLGGGRMTKESLIHPHVGVDHLAKPGEEAKPGALLARIHAMTDADADRALATLRTAITLGDTAPELPPLIEEVL